MKFAIKHIKNLFSENISSQSLSLKLMQLGHENEIFDDIIDLEITPNRGDCLSLMGIQRDLGNFFKSSNKFDIYMNEIPKLHLDFLNTAIEDCTKISFLKIEIEDIPNEYKPYLENYFIDLKINKIILRMFPITSPMRLANLLIAMISIRYSSSFQLCRLKKSTSFNTLIGKRINLKEKELVFKKENEVINLAGVMGGSSTSCSEKTTEVLVECAFNRVHYWKINYL